jgi:hypothetical protein
MGSFANNIVWTLRIFFTICVFFLGQQIGRLQSEIDTQSLPACPVHPRQKIYVDTNVDVTTLPKCGGPKIYDHCIRDYFDPHTFLHLVEGFIPDYLFPNLHHPSTPAKAAVVINQQREWQGNQHMNQLPENCQEIYVTRTGSRSSQPNKCVAVVRAPEGVTSIVQHGHRYGYTALLTNQYQADFSRSTSYPEEQELMAPLLKELPELLTEFKRKLGNPINPDGSRRSVIVMVANDGVLDLLLNFLCSAEQAQIDVSSVAVFVGEFKSIFALNYVV